MASVPAFASDAESQRVNINYLHTELNKAITNEVLVEHVFKVLEERSRLDGGPVGFVRGHLIVSYGGPGVTEVAWDYVAKYIERVLVDGHTYDEKHFQLERDGWMGLSLLTPKQIAAVVNVPSVTEDDIFESCEAVFRPRRGN